MWRYLIALTIGMSLGLFMLYCGASNRDVYPELVWNNMVLPDQDSFSSLVPAVKSLQFKAFALRISLMILHDGLGWSWVPAIFLCGLVKLTDLGRTRPRVFCMAGAIWGMVGISTVVFIIGAIEAFVSGGRSNLFGKILQAVSSGAFIAYFLFIWSLCGIWIGWGIAVILMKLTGRGEKTASGPSS
jgi:hypothetical protein